ncbi:MAG TPA: hypothetical protein VL738_37320 [Dactylosporangium sp.]|nr:hypothetical protein [Dactylosporangium sp.]
MGDDMSPEQARAALDRASRLSERIGEAGARWIRVGKWVMAAIFASATLTWGFVEPLALRTVLTLSVVAAAVAWAFVWARADRAVGRARPRRRLWEFDLTALAFLVVVLAGDAVKVDGHALTGAAWYWIPAALAVAAPLTVSAFRTRRP